MPPAWRIWRGLLYVAVGQLLARAGRLLPGPVGRRRIGTALLVLGLVLQMVLVWLAGYLIDLSIDLASLWLELVRKHLEITLS